MPDWAIWVIVAVALAIGEVLTLGFWLGAIALAAVLIGTLLAAIVGGKAGEHYHRKVDRAGLEA
jgi:membrane protein implicated in regulation of membrane protease activity